MELVEPKFYPYYRWQHAKQVTPSKKRRSSKTSIGSPPIQHLYVQSSFHDFRKVCLCWWFSIVAFFWNLKGLGGDFHDMSTLSAYLQTWRLMLSHTKTVTAAFPLNNREAKHELKAYTNDRFLPYCPTSTYLEVKLDRSLTFRHHLVALCKKLFSRVTLLRQLIGSRWGAASKTLRIATLFLVYLTDE